MAQEIKDMLYGGDNAPKLVETVVGLGGRDVNFSDFDEVYNRCSTVLAGGAIPPFELIQVRGGHYGEV